jgi:oligopeptide/dipeptide ABC transporter ATP-binding protein
MMNVQTQQLNTTTDTDKMLLAVNDLRVYFRTLGAPIRAVDGVSFDVTEGETVALVGESGCGKSVTALALARLVASPGYYAGGEIVFGGKNILKLGLDVLQSLRGAEISYIFQEPSSSLNPVFTAGYQVEEALRLHRRKISIGMGISNVFLDSRLRGNDSNIKCKCHSRPDRESRNTPVFTSLNFRDETLRLFQMVGIPDAEHRLCSYPHQLSGGMQQRIMIAMALACRPKLLVADEPTTALDVTIQAQIMELLAKLQGELGMAVLLITHNLGLVAGIARRVNVMYAGRIVESGLTEEILTQPRHPYTRGLLAAVPRLRSTLKRMSSIPGNVPNPADLPPGCKFHPRCPHARDICRQTEPQAEKITETHGVKCHFWKSII